MTALPDEKLNPFDHLHKGDAMAYIAEREGNVLTKVEDLMREDPKLPFISAYVMAGDLTRADEVMELLREGKVSYEQAETMTGSYGRLNLRVRAFNEGLITPRQAYADLASMWSGSDPDDADPRFLALFKAAFNTNGKRILRDKPGSKLGGTNLTIFRGQDAGAPFGISWSLDRRVAEKFARGAATRQHARDGVVYTATARRRHIMAYMVGRNEAEVIVDPATLLDIHEV